MHRVSDIINTYGSFCGENSRQTKHGLIVSDMHFNQIINVPNSKLKSLSNTFVDSLVLTSLPEQFYTDFSKIISKKLLMFFLLTCIIQFQFVGIIA